MNDQPFSIIPRLAACAAALCLTWPNAASGAGFRIACPPTLEPGSVQGKAPAGWHLAMPQAAPLTGAGMLHGPPEESGYLAPTENQDIRQGGRSGWIQRWRLERPHWYPTFVYCGYGAGAAALRLFHAIPAHATQCTATVWKHADAIQSASFMCS